jgi:hypothetical protein
MRDLEHSRNRWLDQEDVRAGLTGHGTNAKAGPSSVNTATSSPSCSKPTADVLSTRPWRTH